jgi:glycine/D-amino acid oxidase-like deaminating enzyme
MPDPTLSLTRRTLLCAGGAAAAAAALPSPARALGAPRVAVIGAGAMGGWTALWLLRRGAKVSLYDTWGPGNSRASSGGETRVIRGMYGADRVYTEWVVRSFALWRDSAKAWNAELYHPAGALWMFHGDDAYAKAAIPVMQDNGLAVESLEPKAAAKRWPQIDFSGIAHVHFEPEAGYLLARTACRYVVEAFVREGGFYRQGEVWPGEIVNGKMGALQLNDATSAEFDAYVFACGPWLGEIFPDVAAPVVAPTRQEVFFFGTPAGDVRYEEGRLPIWIDFGERIFYGIPGNQHRGFKVADDSHGDRIDPSGLERLPRAEALERARAFLAQRFPGMAGAPLVETRVCQYTNTADGHYLIDRHPGAANAWFVGGGSGHAYKLGPALGEKVAGWVLGDGEPLERFRIGQRGGAADGGKSQLRSGGDGKG